MIPPTPSMQANHQYQQQQCQPADNSCMPRKSDRAQTVNSRMLYSAQYPTKEKTSALNQIRAAEIQQAGK